MFQVFVKNLHPFWDTLVPPNSTIWVPHLYPHSFFLVPHWYLFTFQLGVSLAPQLFYGTLTVPHFLFSPKGTSPTHTRTMVWVEVSGYVSHTLCNKHCVWRTPSKFEMHYWHSAIYGIKWSNWKAVVNLNNSLQHTYIYIHIHVYIHTQHSIKGIHT
jgi:hypothetical protein